MRGKRTARISASRAILRPLLLCAAIFATASYSLAFLQIAQGISGFGIPNGLALAALLRAPRREWPVLIAATLIGNLAAGFLQQNSSASLIVIGALASAGQYGLCADVLRRRFGDYFDLLQPRQLIWLGMVGAITTGLKVALQAGWLGLIPPGATMPMAELLTWSFNNFLGLFVLSLPLLALTAREQGQRQDEQRFRAIFEASPFGIALMDTLDGRFLTVNKTYETIVGWTGEELLGKGWQDITHADDLTPDGRLAAQFNAGLIPGYQFEKRYIRKDGEAVWVNMTIARFALPGTERQQHLCMIEDITERRALENQIHFAQQMESIGQLTGGVAHDFNNLLTIVIGSSETLADQLANPQQRRLAQLILQAAEQGSELIRRLLAFARRQPLEPHPFDVNRLLDSMARLIRRALGADLQFTIDMAADLRPAFADPAQTESAILNLCLNARDAMPDGGRLIIRTENVTLTEDYVRRHPQAQVGDYVAIRISDTGTGIAAHVIDHIFEPFFTTKDTGKGSGLGLSMVYGFIQQSKGSLELTSEIGKGSTFTLHLPVAPAGAATITIAGRDGDTIEGGTENVLVVEDDDLVREHARGQFERLGYGVTVASTGAEALDILERRDDIDLLFTDIVMPGGMNGRQLGEQAVARWPSLRILYTSGYSRDALTRDGRLLDDITLLSKPYSIRDLSEKARKVLDEVP